MPRKHPYNLGVYYGDGRTAVWTYPTEHKRELAIRKLPKEITQFQVWEQESIDGLGAEYSAIVHNPQNEIPF